MRSKDHNNWNIFVINADGTGLKNLTDSSRFAADPSWSPDSKKIAYATERPGQRIRMWVMNADGTERVGADPHTGGPDRVQVEHRRQVVDVGPEEVVGRRGRAARARASGTRRTSLSPPRRISLARSWIQPVMSLPAGPPSGGLYLKPPSRGGLCDGVTTTPSARAASPAARPALCRRIACDTAGVGV